MSYFIHRLLLLAVATTSITVRYIHSMNQEDATVSYVPCMINTSNHSMLMLFSKLPQDIKRYIVFLFLESSLGYDFEFSGNLCIEALFVETLKVLNATNELSFIRSDGTIVQFLIKSEPLFSKGYAALTSVAVSPNGTLVLTGLIDHTARLWDTTGKQLVVLEHAGSVHSVAFSPDGSTIITGSDTGSAYLWDSATGYQLQQLTMPEDTTILFWASFRPDGSTILTCPLYGKIGLWKRCSLVTSDWIEKKKHIAKKLFMKLYPIVCDNQVPTQSCLC